MPNHHRTRIERQGDARFLTFSCYQRIPLFARDSIKDEFVSQLAAVRDRGAFALIAWVVMPEHVHLIIRPDLPAWPVPRVLQAIKQPFAKRIIARWRQLRAPVLPRLVDPRGHMRFWQRGGGYDRNIFLAESRRETIRYIHLNPVRRSLAKSPEEWPWSSARWYAGQKAGALRIDL